MTLAHESESNGSFVSIESGVFIFLPILPLLVLYFVSLPPPSSSPGACSEHTTGRFCYLGASNPAMVIFEQHVIRRSGVFEALKLLDVRSDSLPPQDKLWSSGISCSSSVV